MWYYKVEALEPRNLEATVVDRIDTGREEEPNKKKQCQ